MNSNPLLLLAINQLPGARGWLKYHVWKECRDEADLDSAIQEYRYLRSFGARSPIPSAQSLLKSAETIYARLRRYRIAYRVLGEANYPPALSLIAEPPLLLFHRGTPRFDCNPAIAVVGTRRPSATAQRQAYQLGLEFALSSYPVVSGLAIGIDKSAHEGVLAGKGITWAVLACGLDRPSPMSNRKLAGEILDRDGALLGEITPGNYPAKYAFHRRNRILSGLARGCIVVQAPKKSGALITANFALDQNRDLYVGSAGLGGSISEGTRNLEVQGAPAINHASDVLNDWGRVSNEQRIEGVQGPRTSVDLSRMMRLELEGCIFRHMGGWFEYSGA